MRLFELAGPEREGFKRVVAQINDYFAKNVAPSKVNLDRYYVQQWPKPMSQAYVKSMTELTRLYQGLAHDIQRYTADRQTKEAGYKFPVVVIDTIKKQLAQHVKNSTVKPKDIHMAKYSDEVRYKDLGAVDPLEVEKTMKELSGNLKDSLNKPVKPRKGQSTENPGPAPVPPVPPVPPVEPTEPKKPGTDLSTDVKLKQLGYDDTVKGEFIPGENPDRTKLDKYGEIINGEWTVVNDAMKQLPDLTPKQLMDLRPKAGDYVEFTGGPRSSRPGEPNIAKINGLATGKKGQQLLRVTSVNQQPNPSRQGREFSLDAERVKREGGQVRYLSKADLQKNMPQLDPKKYRKPGAGTTVHQGTGIGGAIKKGMKDVKRLKNYK